jgi:hypothetical protein
LDFDAASAAPPSAARLAIRTRTIRLSVICMAFSIKCADDPRPEGADIEAVLR